MNSLLDKLDNDTVRIVLGGILAFFGGIVRVCGNQQKQPWKMIISSLMASVFAGYITAVAFHDRISDINYFGVVCALGGYSGQLVLVIASKRFEKFIIGRFIK